MTIDDLKLVLILINICLMLTKINIYHIVIDLQHRVAPIRTTLEFGRALAEGRRRRGLTQARLAEAIGTSRYWVIRAERGEPGIEFGLVLRAFRHVGIALEPVAIIDDDPIRGDRP